MIIKKQTEINTESPVTKDAIAQYFGRTRRWVELQVKNNAMPCIRITKRTIRFRIKDCQTWMDGKVAA